MNWIPKRSRPTASRPATNNASRAGTNIPTAIEFLRTPRAGLPACGQIRHLNPSTEKNVMTKPIPDGFHTISPHIVVQDAARAIEFYKKAFGATENARHTMPDGKA